MKSRWCKIGEIPNATFVSDAGNKLFITQNSEITFMKPSDGLLLSCRDICEISYPQGYVLLTHRFSENHQKDAKRFIEFIVDAYQIDEKTKADIYECAGISDWLKNQITQRDATIDALKFRIFQLENQLKAQEDKQQQTGNIKLFGLQVKI